MLHYTLVKKNKHQNKYKTLPVEYLYDDHVSSKKPSSHLSAKTRAELNDDIYYMRRQFKRTVNKLARDLYDTSWVNNRVEDDRYNERMRLRSRHA